MTMYSYDQVLTDVRHVYEQLTGLPAPKLDIKNPAFPLPKEGDAVSLVQGEINNLNLYLINSGISLRLTKTPIWSPPAEIYETPERYVVNVELAGIKPEDVTIQQLNQVLIVRGTRRFRRASEDAQYLSSERIYGAFERMFPIPDHVRSESLKTSFADGVLEITFARSGVSGGPTPTGKKSEREKAG
ncbi:MAG TPA: Hsp20/alpha crystallin family protein [Blastocatellia bacterium]|nr:Hsp20/alpha crystallin family protein [Blastocatellia bacterium]